MCCFLFLYGSLGYFMVFNLKRSNIRTFVFLSIFLIPRFSIMEPFIDDKIVCIIYDAEESVVITQKDIDRANILGRPQSLYNLKLDALMCRDARNLKISLPDDAVERMIEQIQKQNNISLDQLKTMLAAEGHTLDSYRTELKNMQIINMITDFRVHSRAIVPYEQIVAYYDAHPVMQEPRYQLITCFVPFDTSITNSVQKQTIIKQLSKKNSFDWTDPFWIHDSDIAQTKEFIKTMELHSSVIQQEQNGFRIYTLLDMQKSVLVPLTERYEEIVKILKEPLEKELLEQYHKELLENAIIVEF